MTIQVDNWKAY